MRRYAQQGCAYRARNRVAECVPAWVLSALGDAVLAAPDG
jgi:hypothetical protein